MAEWDFLVTSCGKSACDSIGGTAQRLFTKTSLQHLFDDHVLTALGNNIHGIHFFHDPVGDVVSCENELKPRLNLAMPIKGTLQSIVSSQNIVNRKTSLI